MSINTDGVSKWRKKNVDKTLKSDVLFKILFGDARHPRLLISLLNAILDLKEPITGVDIQQTELTPESLGKKGVRLDVLAKTSDGRLINIEIQKKDEHNMCARTLFYWSRIFSGQAVVNSQYQDLRQTICINILAYNLFEDGRYWHRGVFEDEETHEKLTDLLEIHFLELKKIKKRKPESPLMFWLEFIDNPESEKIKHMYKLEAVYQEAKERYDDAIADPMTKEMIRIREKAEMDYNDALAYSKEKGKKEGRVEEKIEIAKNLLAMRMPIEQVMQGTGLSIEEILKLKMS